MSPTKCTMLWTNFILILIPDFIIKVYPSVTRHCIFCLLLTGFKMNFQNIVKKRNNRNSTL